MRTMFKDGLMRDTGKNRDGRIVKCAEEFRRGMIGNRTSRGCCAMICWPLATLLHVEFGMDFETPSRNGIAGMTMNHVWIAMPDGRVLDPTMDQFGAQWPKVYLGEPVKGIHLP